MEDLRERIATLEALGDIAARDRAEMLKALAELSAKFDALDRKLSAYESEARGAMKAGAAFKALAIAGWGLVTMLSSAAAAYLWKLPALPR